MLCLLTFGCSAASLVRREPTPTPLRTLAPTFTATAVETRLVLAVTPPSAAAQGVIIVPPGVDPAAVLPPTPTPTVTLTPTPVTPTLTPTAGPTATPTATGTPTVTPTATPYVQARAGGVNLRTGPGSDYPLLTLLTADTPVAVVGRNPGGDWLQICCVNGESVWVAAALVTVVNPIAAVPLVLVGPPPTPTETPTPGPTFTPTPIIYPFERAEGPIFMPTNNGFLSIWVMVFANEPPDELPLEGYRLEAHFETFDRPNTLGEPLSGDRFNYQYIGQGDRLLALPYNYKYEYKPYPSEFEPFDNSIQSRSQAIADIGTGTWTIVLRDSGGRQVADAVTFFTNPGNPHREIYVAWIRRR